MHAKTEFLLFVHLTLQMSNKNMPIPAFETLNSPRTITNQALVAALAKRSSNACLETLRDSPKLVSPSRLSCLHPDGLWPSPGRAELPPSAGHGHFPLTYATNLLENDEHTDIKCTLTATLVLRVF